MRNKKGYRLVVHWLARYGSISIGMVYVMVGVVALLSFLKMVDGGADEDTILAILKDLPFGKIFIWVIIAGMIGYIIWRVFESIADPYGYGKSIPGLARRIGIALSSFAYGLIAYSGIEVLLGLGRKEMDVEAQQQTISRVYEWIGGEWLIGIVGVIVGITGLLEFKYVLSRDYDPRLDTEHLSKSKQIVINVLAWIGHFARGIILLIIAYTFILSAIQSDPEEAVNTDKAFNFIGEGFFGHPLFIAIAIGTICYGLFMFALGIFYQFDREKY